MPYLIDGHNVIAALPDISLEDDNDEAQLVIKLRSWTSRIRRKAIVIFDGGITGGLSSDLSSPDVHVVFAARFHTNADRIISERLKALRDAPNWTVISSDHEVLDQARLAGARVMTAQHFAEQINRPLTSEPEKPEYVSPAAVNAWLEMFPEPDITTEPTPITAPSPKPKAPPRRQRPPSAKSIVKPKQERRTRSIGEQLGRAVTPESQPNLKSRRVEKPSDISAEEVDAWLQVFHDPVESSVPEPQPALKRTKPKRKKRPVVRKQGDLTQDEVSTWLHIFPEPDPSSIADKQADKPAKKRKYRQRKLDKTLAQHKAKLSSSESTTRDESNSSLSEEDREMWQRMFGSEE